MFCHLYVMFDRTSLPLYEKERCFDECSFCKDGNCVIAIKKSEKLNSDRFGWIHEMVIEFNEPKQSKSGSTKYLSAISLIHPSTSDIWIVKCERLNKVSDEWYNVYRLYRSGDCIEFDDLDSLNKWMTRQKFDGRKIEVEDFNLVNGE
jgi:hypothetical protein